MPEVEFTDENLVIYAASGTTMSVYVDDILQDTASAAIAVPNMGALSIRGFVGLVFGGAPEARPSGKSFEPIPRKSTFRRLIDKLYGRTRSIG